VMARLVELLVIIGRLTMALVGESGSVDRGIEMELVTPHVTIPSPTKPALHTHTPMLLRLALALQGERVSSASAKHTSNASNTLACDSSSFQVRDFAMRRDDRGFVSEEWWRVGRGGDLERKVVEVVEGLLMKVEMSLMEKPGCERGDGRKLGWSTGVDTGEVYSASEGSDDEIER